MAEVDPLDKARTLLDGDWVVANVKKPTIDLWNLLGPLENLKSNDFVAISYFGDGHTEEYMNHWDYKRTRDKVQFDVRTAVSHQRLLDLMAEIRRIVIARRKDFIGTGYHRWKFIGFRESTDTRRKTWTGVVTTSFESDGVLIA